GSAGPRRPAPAAPRSRFSGYRPISEGYISRGCLPDARHQFADAFRSDLARPDISGDPPAKQDGDPVANGDDMFELGRNIKNADPLIALRDQGGLHKFDGPDVEPLAGLGHNQKI